MDVLQDQSNDQIHEHVVSLESPFEQLDLVYPKLENVLLITRLAMTPLSLSYAWTYAAGW